MPSRDDLTDAVIQPFWVYFDPRNDRHLATITMSLPNSLLSENSPFLDPIIMIICHYLSCYYRRPLEPAKEYEAEI